jgi:epoxyqueuosine reductase
MGLDTKPEAWLRECVSNFVQNSPANNLQDQHKERAFDAPLVGFARGHDKIFAELKQHVGPFHWTPKEIFNLTFPEKERSGDKLSVISFILPQTRATKHDNSIEKRYPAERWARARTFGELFNERIRTYLVEVLRNHGIRAVAPALSPYFEKKESLHYGYASTWSERHVAHGCGLGTFGLSDGLITPLGKAVRIGSVVANIRLNPDPRPYDNHNGYCLFHVHSKCGKCIDRCPVGAITAKGHDKVRCKNFTRGEAKPYIEATYGFSGHSCGLCQTKVPCESRIPVRLSSSANIKDNH